MTSILVHIFIITYDEGHSWGGNMPELHALPIITLLAALLGLAQWLCIPNRSSRLLSASSTSSAQLKLLPEFLVVCSNWSQSLRRQPTIWQRYHFIIITIIIMIVTVTIVKSSDDVIHLPKNLNHCILPRRAAQFAFFSCCNDSLRWKWLYFRSLFLELMGEKNLKLETEPRLPVSDTVHSEVQNSGNWACYTYMLHGYWVNTRSQVST